MSWFEDLLSLSTRLKARCIERWSEILHGVLPGSVTEAYALERGSLMPVGGAFDGFVKHAKHAKQRSSTCLVHLEGNRYSVLASFAHHFTRLAERPHRR